MLAHCSMAKKLSLFVDKTINLVNYVCVMLRGACIIANKTDAFSV